MLCSSLVLTATLVGVTVCVGCADRLNAPEAVELVNRLDEAFAHGEGAQQWLGNVWKGDLRLGALSRIELRRDDVMRPYQTVVFERLVPAAARAEGDGQLSCAGPRRAAYFWHADNDGMVFFPEGWFDQRLVGCVEIPVQGTQPLLRVVTPDAQAWIAESLQGEISPGVVTGRCPFLAPDSERILSEEHGLTCALTRHRVHLAAALQNLAENRPVRVALDTTEIIGVRYTIDCTAARSPVSSCLRGPSDRSLEERDRVLRPRRP